MNDGRFSFFLIPVQQFELISKVQIQFWQKEPAIKSKLLGSS